MALILALRPTGCSAARDSGVASVAGLAAALGRPRRAAVLPAYPAHSLTQALIFAILAMSLDVLLGYTGCRRSATRPTSASPPTPSASSPPSAGGFLGCLAAGIALAALTAAVFGCSPSAPAAHTSS
jgi:ABC-type branched-subunit amino acid transport system permease subunit